MDDKTKKIPEIRVSNKSGLEQSRTERLKDQEESKMSFFEKFKSYFLEPETDDYVENASSDDTRAFKLPFSGNKESSDYSSMTFLDKQKKAQKEAKKKLVIYAFMGLTVSSLIFGAATAIMNQVRMGSGSSVETQQAGSDAADKTAKANLDGTYAAKKEQELIDEDRAQKESLKELEQSVREEEEAKRNDAISNAVDIANQEKQVVIDSLTSANKELQSSNETLTKDNNTLKNENNGLKDESNKLKDENNRIKEELEQVKAENERLKNNTSSSLSR